MVVVSFVLNVELVGDSVTNSEQHRRLTEDKLLVSWRKCFPYLSLHVEIHLKNKKKDYKQNPRNPECFSKE